MLTELVVLFTAFLYQLSTQIDKLLVSILAHSLGVSSTMIGALVAVQAFFPFLLVIPIGRVPVIFATLMQTHGLARAFVDTGFLLFGWGTGAVAFAAWHRLGDDLGVRDAAGNVTGMKDQIGNRG